MLRVGLTGAVASGKSTVSRLLCAQEIPVIDADRVAHELYVPGSDLVEASIAISRVGLTRRGIASSDSRSSTTRTIAWREGKP